jgi:hypothetical protein
VFGRRRRDEAQAAEAAREAERHALFAKLAERPDHICPFLGLEGDRTGYVEGISEEHRCFAFGEPAPLSAEQQTRVCQERGYGNCPRYLRGVLVIPTEELEALRRPHAPLPEPAAAPPPKDRPRRRGPVLLLLALLLLLVGGGAAYVALNGFPGAAVASPTPGTTASAASTPMVTASASATSAPTPPPTARPTPTPEPTPEQGDTFAFYEVSVGPASFEIFRLDDGTEVLDSTTLSFDDFSFARVEPLVGDDGAVYWVTREGDLTGWAYRYPDSGEFRIRAVFLNGAGDRRSAYLEQDQLATFPEATPAP